MTRPKKTKHTHTKRIRPRRNLVGAQYHIGILDATEAATHRRDITQIWMNWHRQKKRPEQLVMRWHARAISIMCCAYTEARRKMQTHAAHTQLRTHSVLCEHNAMRLAYGRGCGFGLRFKIKMRRSQMVHRHSEQQTQPRTGICLVYVHDHKASE